MFVRQDFQTENGARRAYWALVESYRTEAGPRQRIVAWLGKLDEAGRLGVEQAAKSVDGHNSAKPGGENAPRQLVLFDQPENEDAASEPRWVEVNSSAVRVENCVQFGGPWLALQLIHRLRLDEFLRSLMPAGRERVAWWRSALILVVARLCDPSSELYVAEQWYPKSAFGAAGAAGRAGLSSR
ncbi:MAG: hypothetical protein KDA58_14470 [Planctomycetaceae bacterium]|nr:hypothetical protein [Planctomycetaceae bacterium]